ncbi:hypothetical protein TRFO_21593 [Tritrichomonas foetus]|uniref:Nucleoplasmin-like domain-containing protein n=1 Tax=Tritrichomonas foetus TaxID=1144522 RepID=A0A1J4KET6_9EUKA|nr:hypothetical protein TRFO_21593 [Tritrichomonas foetus]|eukprot:OHT09538.1 hypothetical protein TRFO_21593 [Tritrichomonas foetus]
MNRTIESTFFGLVVNPNFDYKTLLNDDVLLTNAVIAPEALPEQTARLLIKVDNTRVPLCQLDGSRVTSAPLNIQLFPGVEIVFNVAGDCPIHVSGFYSPHISTEPPQFISAPGFDLGGDEQS